MSDAYRAVRQSERFMGKSHEELMRETNSQAPEPDGRVLAAIIYTHQYDAQGNLRNIEQRVQRADEVL